MDERAFYKESPAIKPITLNCPYCRTQDTYDLRWLRELRVPISLPTRRLRKRGGRWYRRVF